MNLLTLAERGLLPDGLIRYGIRRLLAERVRATDKETASTAQFADKLRSMPLAVHTDAANRQHYEVPARFYELVLGPRLKYSCCLYESPSTTLAEAERAMLALTCQRADLADGMQILELGCGWGSLTLWMAEHYPSAMITAVSNSSTQKAYIDSRARTAGFGNVRVITADMRDFKSPADYGAPGAFDRVVSVEMFEHMRNYEELFHRVAGWLTPDGKAFVHVFSHAGAPYLFETNGADARGSGDWMARHFFTGGTMPSDDLFAHFGADLKITEEWRVDGTHYARTCADWLANLDRHRSELLRLFGHDLPPHEARITLQRWRIFFMACGELFNYRDGAQWGVCHYLFEL